MSLLTHAFKSLLKLGEIVGGGGAGKVARILREHFTLTAFQLAETYQTSYLNTLEAIRRGCAPRWVDWRSQVEKDFSDQVRLYYLIEFANEKAWTDADITQFKQYIAAECDKLLKCKAVIFESDGQLFDEKTLAGLLTTEKLSNLTDLVFERLQVLKITISPEVANFLRYRELLGKGIEFFVRNDREITNRLHALQAAGLWDTMQEVKQIVESLQQVGIRPRIEAEDEFKTYDSESIKRVGQAVVLLKNQPFKPADQGRALLMAGTAILALNSLDEAKRLLEEALQLAQCDEERALAHFNLFQVYLRYSEPNYNDIAFEHLQTALALDAPKTFHFYEPRKYSLLKLLGAGGMGCAFLAEDVSFERKVVLKAFWKTFEQETRDLFREVLAMKKVSRQFVPEPFGVEFYGHHAYLLTEYIENALDGEQWLRDKGKLNNELAVDVAWQIATGLHAAHQQGVLHLDLKPANVLLIPTADRVAVKLIDFGLAKVVTPLHSQIRRTQRQTTQFGVRVAGTWDYAPPEQRGNTNFGKPSAKSDVFSFGKTMLRLCSGRDPANCRERDVPDELRDLLFDCVEEDPSLRPTFESIVLYFTERQENNDDLFNKALALEQQEKFDEALTIYHQLLEVNPKHENALVGIGYIFGTQGKLDKALTTYHKLLTVNPKHEFAWSGMGGILHTLGRLDEALAAYHQLLEINPKHESVWFSIGSVLYAQGRLDEALSAYHKLLEINPKPELAWHGIGMVLYTQRRLDEALVVYRQLLEINSEDESSWDTIGYILEEQGKLDEALVAYNKLLEINPKHEDAWHSIGCVLEKQENLKKSLVAYRKQLEINPKCDMAWHSIGIVFGKQGKLDEALIAYRKQLKINPEHELAWNGIGIVFGKQGKLDEAIVAFRKQLDINPKHDEAWNNMGYAIEKQGKLDEAIAAYRKALEINPEYELAKNNLDILLKKRKTAN